MMDEENSSEDVLTNFDYYYNNHQIAELSPEKRLMYSVLIYGVIDFLSANRKYHYKDARRWFYDDSLDYIYSFQNICFVMGINATEFKIKLKALKKTKVKFALDGKRITN